MKHYCLMLIFQVLSNNVKDGIENVLTNPMLVITILSENILLAKMLRKIEKNLMINKGT